MTGLLLDIVEKSQHIAHQQMQQLKLIAQWDASGEWAMDGSRSCAYRLARETKTSVPTCKRQVTLARKLASMPACVDAVERGELSFEQFELLAQANQPALSSEFARDEEFLIRTVCELRFMQAQKAVRYWQELANDAVAKDKAQSRFNQRRAFISTHIDGNVRLDADLDVIGGDIFKRELELIEKELFERDWADKADRTPTQRRADALVEMARRSHRARSNKHARPLITILAGEGPFKNILELANGTVLSPTQVVPLLADAQIETILFKGPKRVIEVSHKREFTGALRRAIEIRDRHCQHTSGCDEPLERCQVDHVVAWAKGGPTNQANGQLLCATHNRAKGSGPP